MYTINKQKGIGQVISQDEKFVTVYFEETEEEKKLLLAFTTVYKTLEEAELALNPEMTQEIVDAIMITIEADKKIMSDGAKAQDFIANYHANQSKQLFKNI